MLITFEFFNVVIGPELRTFILGRKYSLMVLAACGSVVKVPSAFEEVRQVSNEYVRPAVTMQILTSLSCLL